jgi:hypothetical protein
MPDALSSIEAAAAAQDRIEQGLPPTLQEWGSTGLNRSGGQITEEYLPELVGSRGVKVYREMETDPIAGAMVMGLTRLLARLEWKIEDAEGAGPLDVMATEFIDSAFTDMDVPWSNVLEEVLSMVTYGWAFLETNYKLRMGPDQAEDWRRSTYNDAKLGWKSFRIRGQETLVRWIFDARGNVIGMEQMDPNGAGLRPLPLAKALLFRTTTVKDNPEGRSMLRGAYRPWYFKKRIEEYEAIGIERDLAGLPVARLGPEYFAPDASAAHKATLKVMQDLVSAVRMDASGGVVLPVAYDDHGNKLIDFELMAAAGSKQIDTNAVIKRKSEEMAMSILMDFLMLGHQNVGSFALGTAKIDLWTLSVDALARGIAETFNKYAIEPLLRANRMRVDKPPRLVYGEVSNVDLGSLSTFIREMTDAGMLTPSPELETWVREVAKLPAMTEEVEDIDTQERQASRDLAVQ